MPLPNLPERQCKQTTTANTNVLNLCTLSASSSFNPYQSLVRNHSIIYFHLYISIIDPLLIGMRPNLYLLGRLELLVKECFAKGL